MISLQDQIKKFQNQLYSKELDEFIPIDDQFIGGGITMESLIKENAFIASQLKKMKGVFQNYCKLNQNVYSKISEHELNLHKENIKINKISNSMGRHLDDTVRQVKELHEQTLYHSQRAKETMTDLIKPIQDQIRLKVDESSFSTQMKKIMEEFEEEENNLNPSSVDNDAQIDINSISSKNQTSLQKRRGKGGVSIEEFNLEKEKNSQLFSEIEKKLKLIAVKNLQKCEEDFKRLQRIVKLQQISVQHENQILKATGIIDKMRSYIGNVEDRLFSELDKKTNDAIWTRKFEEFNNKAVEPKIKMCEKLIKSLEKQTNWNFSELEPRFTLLDEEIEKNTQSIQENTSKIETHESTLLQNKQESDLNCRALGEKITEAHCETMQMIKKNIESIQRNHKECGEEFQTLHKKIENLSQQIEETVLKGVSKKVSVQIKNIEKSIFQLGVKDKEIFEKLNKHSGQMTSVKQVLSKKVNFSDIMLHFQRKADKQDFKELREKIDTSPTYLKSTIIDSPDRTTKRTISEKSHSNYGSNNMQHLLHSRRNSNGKEIFNPVTIEHQHESFHDEDFEEGGSKIFMCGLEKDFPLPHSARRFSYTSNAKKRKRMNSTVGMSKCY